MQFCHLSYAAREPCTQHEEKKLEIKDVSHLSSGGAG